ncbi:MAG: FGGY-family carbohydrate kinase [Oscillospiraceae bacterium]
MSSKQTNYALGIDIGTTAVKVVLIGEGGEYAAEVNRPHNLLSLHPGWAEEDAGVWWQNTCDALAELARLHPGKMGGVRGIGVSGMVPAIVLLGQNGEVLRNTIQQNDARAAGQVTRLQAEINQEELYARTCGYTNQQHVLPRLLWVKENEPGVWQNTAAVLGSYDYIVYRLTGQKQVEINWAVESGLFDVHTRRWLTGDMQRYGVSPGLFPAVSPSGSVVGHTGGLASLGLADGIPVIAGSADHVASAFSAGILEEGSLLIKFGGAGDILYCVNEIAPCKDLFFDFHLLPGKYLVNGCMAASGSLVKWYTKDILGEDGGQSLQELDRRAEKVPPASDGLIILPYLLGEKTPLFDPAARGVLFGLTLAHTKEHIFRAVLEAVIYGFRHHLEVMEQAGLHPTQIIATNGGAKSAFWCQIAADVLARPVLSYPKHPGSALGVAFLAGLSTGVFASCEELHLFLQQSKVYTPKPENIPVYNRAYAIYRGLYQQLRPSFAAVQQLYEGYGAQQA